MAPKVRVAGILAALVMLTIPITAQAEGRTLKGQIVNGTTGQPQSGLAVNLHITPTKGGAESTLESQTDSNGVFAFEGVDLSSGSGYALCTTYQSAMYHEPLTLPSKDEGEIAVKLTVYDVTETRDAVSLTSHHVVFNPVPARGAVEVMEFLSFDNSGNRTFVGKTAGADVGQTLRFSLPRGASELTWHDGLSQDQVQSFQGGFASLSPVFPGKLNVVYSYLLPISGESLRFSRALDYYPSQVVLLVGDGKGTISGPGVSPQGPVDMEGVKYQLYRASPPANGTALELVLSGWGAVRGRSRWGEVAPIIGGTAAAGGLFGVLAYAVLSRRRRPVSTASATSHTPPPPPTGEDWDEELQ